MTTTDSQAAWIKRANAVLPAGGFGNYDPGIIIRNGKGSHVWDENGKQYIDYLIGSGPMLLGHGHPEVLDVVQNQLSNGMTFFANNAAGIELAEAICEAVPWRQICMHYALPERSPVRIKFLNLKVVITACQLRHK